MKKLLLFIMIFCVSITSCADNSISLHDSDGKLLKMTFFKDKWVIINYWAPWCETCVEEIPELNKFYEHNINKNVLLYGVNYDQPPRYELQQAVHQMGISFPVLLEDPNVLWNLGEIAVIPMTFIINPQGKVVKRIIGLNTEDSLRSIMNVYVPASSS